ncbi:hypothetical protein GN244_ATG03168 [Phytophthora infestans]|uniref:Uncharacterized protein n=1 Tax=Phytophthora infestans TaxID=4787 RepID=A0A833TDN0_PHYIN|nr:hypothetical protein GN244_ATG03168 [Phytophthora infestans]
MPASRDDEEKSSGPPGHQQRWDDERCWDSHGAGFEPRRLEGGSRVGPSPPGDDRFGLRFENQRRYDGSRGYGTGYYGGGYEEGRV